ncbi:hypothetical protein F8M41_006004 [Gigaspora margarita]|uniref:Uncharacterized protein n=1 Tax=Gigaspora margarita TaxID=4874 RepID=A0A8H4A4G6_GIGMA|nr:hypothetical protein F8M41_006004 [Gigaspora margarita]
MAGTPASEKRKLWWKLWLIINFIFYLLLVLSIFTVYRSREQGQTLTIAFVIIILVEIIQRIIIVYSIYKEVGLSFCEMFCVLIFKGEYYLLWGNCEIDEKTVDKLNTISDLFSIAYLAVLVWVIYNGLSKLKHDPDVKRNFLITSTLVTIIAAISFIKFLISLLKQFCNLSPPPYSSSV